MKQKILFAEKFFPMIRDGRKTTTVRSGVRNYNIGECLALDPEQVKGFVINIKTLQVSTYGELNEEIAKTDGFESLSELKYELRTFYPELVNSSYVTIVSFEYVRELEEGDLDGLVY